MIRSERADVVSAKPPVSPLARLPAPLQIKNV